MSRYSDAQDKAIIQLGLLRMLFYSGTIDEETFKAGKQRLGNDVENWRLSQHFFNSLKASHENTRGRKKKVLPDLNQIFNQADEGTISVTQACKILGISRSTYYRRYRVWKEEG